MNVLSETEQQRLGCQMNVGIFMFLRKMRSRQVRTEKPRMPPLITLKVNERIRFCLLLLFIQNCSWVHFVLNYIYFHAADGQAYSALLKNELLGAGIEKILDPQTEDRRLQPSTPEKRSLFTVRTFHHVMSEDVAH